MSEALGIGIYYASRANKKIPSSIIEFANHSPKLSGLGVFLRNANKDTQNSVYNMPNTCEKKSSLGPFLGERNNHYIKSTRTVHVP